MLPPSQSVRVLPASESDRIPRPPSRPSSSDSAPVRCQLWDGDRHVSTTPVRFDDMGHPTDVTWTPRAVEAVDRLVFLWGGKVYIYPLPERLIIRPGQPLHLALGHLKLLDRYGQDVLAAGR